MSDLCIAPLSVGEDGSPMILPEEEGERLYAKYWHESVELNYILTNIVELRLALESAEHTLLRKVGE